MIRYAFIGVFLVSFSVFSETKPQTIGLEQAINMALTGNRDIAALELELNGRVLSAETARYKFAFNLLPQADAIVSEDTETYGYGLRGTKQLPVGSELEAGINAANSEFDEDEETRSGIIHVQLTQPLFRDWGLLVNKESIRRADSNVTAARRTLELRKSDLLVSVVENYQGLLRLERLIADEQRTIDRYDRMFRLTRAREKQGRATRVERLRVELLKGQAESRKIAFEEQLRSLQADFTDQLGAEPNQLFIPMEDEELKLDLPDRDEAIAVALQNRLDFAQALHDQIDTKRGMRIARKQLQPGISVIGRYEWSGEGDDWDDAWAFDQENWTVGLVTDSDLLLREERAGVRQAALNEASAALRVEDVIALVRRQIDQALSDMRKTGNEQKIAEQNLELARQRANLSQRLFEKGRIDNTQATDAEIEFQEANTQLLNARAETVIAGYRLLRIMGVLVESPDDLKPPARQS